MSVLVNRVKHLDSIGNRNQNFPASNFLQRNSTCFCNRLFFFIPRSTIPMEWRAVA